MELRQFYTELQEIESIVRRKGLNAAARGHVNWFGDEVSVEITAAEPFDDKGHWSRTREFVGTPQEMTTVLRDAYDWSHALPEAEDRAIELMIQKLNKLAGELPKGSTDIARAAWAEVHAMLIGKAKRLAENGLPSPNRISELRAS